MRLVLAARSRDLLDELAEIAETDCLVQAVDLAIRRRRRHGGGDDQALRPLDLLVNNAGATQRGDFLKLGDEAWRTDSR
jgi:3-oxoacyl-[acyl-carrier protein] reductase